MQKITLEKIRSCFFLAGLYFLSEERIAHAAESMAIDRASDSGGLYDRLIFAAFKTLEMLVLGPLLLIWLLTYLFLHMYRKKGKDYRELSAFFQELDAALLFGAVLYLFLYVSSYYLEANMLDHADFSFYATAVLYLAGSSALGAYLWLLMRFAKFMIRTRMVRRSGAMAGKRKEEGAAQPVSLGQRSGS